MIKFIYILLLTTISFAIDLDLDGVDDSKDKCLDTPFLEIVNKEGCSKEQLLKKNKIKFTISLGYEYDKYNTSSNNLLLTNLTAYNKIYTISYSSSTLDNKLNDSILAFYYKNKISNKIKLKLGAKIYFTTNYNQKTDYASKIKLIYYKNDLSFAISEQHKIYSEDNTNDKDTIMLEINKNYKNYFLSIYAYKENSIYDKTKWYNYIGIYYQYYINNKLSVSIDYSTSSNNDTIVTNIIYNF